jgi:hypothetical protein
MPGPSALPALWVADGWPHKPKGMGFSKGSIDKHPRQKPIEFLQLTEIP